MQDTSILKHINHLIAEEHRLQGTATEVRRLKQIEIELDQCWDLLRQRRARREFGDDPNQAGTRDPKTVEGYTG